MSGINPIPRTDIYFFFIHSNIVLSSTPRPSKGLFPMELTNSIAYGTRRLNASSARTLSILPRIILIPRSDTYMFNIISNVVLSSTPRPSRGLFPMELTNSIAYGTRRLNASSARTLSILPRIILIPRSDTYMFNIISNIVLSSIVHYSSYWTLLLL
jgi:hypothetical protein